MPPQRWPAIDVIRHGGIATRKGSRHHSRIRSLPRTWETGPGGIATAQSHHWDSARCWFQRKQEIKPFAHAWRRSRKREQTREADSQKSTVGASYFRVIKELFGAIPVVMRPKRATAQALAGHA